jgi:hypothetical protein
MQTSAIGKLGQSIKLFYSLGGRLRFGFMALRLAALLFTRMAVYTVAVLIVISLLDFAAVPRAIEQAPSITEASPKVTRGMDIDKKINDSLTRLVYDAPSIAEASPKQVRAVHTKKRANASVAMPTQRPQGDSIADGLRFIP